MSAARVDARSDWRRKPAPEIGVDVVIPVLNEAHVLAQSVHTVHQFLTEHVPFRWRIVVAENGSTDGTADVARRLCEELPRVELLVIGSRGRGRALRMAWSRGDADILCYTDVDLSTELEAFPRLFEALVHEGCDVAIGSRLASGAKTVRCVKREIISRGYNQILRWVLRVGFSDAQAGFKAITREVADKVLPLVQDNGWFLDTELLVLSERLGYRIADLPIVWTEDDDSRVKIVRTALDDLRGVWRLRRLLWRGTHELRAAAPARSPLAAAFSGAGPVEPADLAVSRSVGVRRHV